MCGLERQKGLDCNPSSYLQLWNLEKVTFPSLSPFPLLSPPGVVVSLHGENAGQSLHRNLQRVRVQSLLAFPMVTTVCSLAFLWEALGQGDLSPTCEYTPLLRPARMCGLRSHSPCIHSPPGSWLPASCVHPIHLLDPCFTGSGLPAPVPLPQAFSAYFWALHP